MAANRLVCWLAWITIITPFQPIVGTTHWVVTEEGMITQQLDSAFHMKEPHNLIAVLQQERRAKEVLRLQDELEKQKAEIEANEDDTDMEEKFLRTDPDCVEAGRPLTEFELYVSTAISLENKGISIADHLNFKVNESKKMLKPNCSKVYDLPFTMHGFEHLESLQDRTNLSNHPEPDLSYLLPQQQTLEHIGHALTKALHKNRTSWVLYNVAGYYWRIRGNTKQVIECSRRALHFSSHSNKNVALLNLANVLHRSHRSADAAVLVDAAMDSAEDLEVLYFMMGNVLAEKGDYNKSAECFAKTARMNPNLGAAHQRQHAVLCHQKLKAALEAQHISVQKALADLQEYQKKQQHFQEVEQKLLNQQKKSDDQFEANLNYQRQRFLQEMGENPHCEVSALGSGAQFLMCRKEAITESGIFGIPDVEEKEIVTPDTASIRNNCIKLIEGEETCFNISYDLPFPEFQSTSTQYKDAIDNTPVWLKPDWPTKRDCESTYGYTLPDWKEYGQTYKFPSRDLPQLEKLFERKPGDPSAFVARNNGAKCDKFPFMKNKETAMDFIDGITRRSELPPTDLNEGYMAILQNITGKDRIFLSELTYRINQALQQQTNGNFDWIIFNLAAFLWRIMGSHHHVIECLRPALSYAPVEDAVVPLVNAALSMMNVGHSYDALQLLRMALVINNTDPFIHFSLGNSWSALSTYEQAIQEYTAALNLEPNHTDALKALGMVKCYLQITENGHEEEEEAAKPRDPFQETDPEDAPPHAIKNIQVSVEGAIQRESRTVCFTEDGKEDCYVESRIRRYLPKGERRDYCPDPRYPNSKEEKMTPEWKQEKVQAPPPENGRLSEPEEVFVDFGDKEVPPHILRKRVVNLAGSSAKKITVNLKKHENSGNVPSTAHGPHIPSVPAPDVDIEKLLQDKHIFWPSQDECQHFRRLNLRAFYSTWLAVSAKNIQLDEHIDFDDVLPADPMQPECPQAFPASLHTMDHLDGMNLRRQLEYSAEQGLREVLQSISGRLSTTQESGTRIAMALKKNPDSWVISNMAALYWRVDGSAQKALDCLRHALHFSPNDFKDIALISSANVFHRAGLLDDGITVAQMAVDIAPSLVINHFTLANLYSAKGLFDKAIEFYESSLALQPEFQPAVERLKTIQCNILQLTNGDAPTN